MRALLDNADQGGVPDGRLRMMRGADEYAHTFDRVPVHLLICVALDALAIVDRGLDRPSIVAGASIYPFVQNILLGLRAEGLGAVVHDAADAGRACRCASCSGSPTGSAWPATSRSATAPIHGPRS